MSEGPPGVRTSAAAPPGPRGKGYRQAIQGLDRRHRMNIPKWSLRGRAARAKPPIRVVVAPRFGRYRRSFATARDAQ